MSSSNLSFASAKDRPISSRLGSLSLFAASCNFLAGSLVLLGWQSGLEVLKRVHPAMVAMNPATACCLVLSGIAIALHHLRLRWWAMGLGAVIAAIAVAKIIDLTLGGVPVDRLLFSDLLDAERGSYTNRMAPNTAVAIFLVGLSLVFVGSRGRKAQLISQIIAMAVLLISMFALVGYAFGIDELRTIGAFIPMALHTGVSLLIAGVGLLSLSRDHGFMMILRDSGPAGSLARMIFPLAVMVPVVVGAVRLWGQRLGLYGVEGGVAIMVVADVLVTSVLLMGSIGALYRSDCARKDREEALRQSEHLNRTINQASPDCVSLLDVHGNVLFSNEAAIRAYGLENDAELIGRPWGYRLEPSMRAEADAALAAARDGGVGRLTLCLPTPTGEQRWFESLVSKLSDTEGQAIRFIVMSRDITQQKLVEDQVRWAATHDALTGLPNRSLFQTQLDEISHGPDPVRFALLIVDVDDFKQVNDTLGHDAGDALLCTVAQRLRRAVWSGDMVARLGGDEFAIILNGVSKEEDASTVAARIMNDVKTPWVYNGRVSDCRVSIGASIAPTHREETSEILKRADIALYAAKTKDRGRVAVFQPRMRAEMQRRSSELLRARRALQEDLLAPFYQPKVELASGKIIGFEALLRWRHPKRGIQTPSSIRTAFADLELAREITDRMLKQILEDMRRWIEEGVEFGHVAMNAAPADFSEEDFAERVVERLELAGIPRSCFQIEVTESVFLGRGAECVERALKALSASGIRIALDDFGTGYASLSHLKQFPVDILKIDRSFVQHVQDDAHDGAILKTILSLGRSLDLDVVAEGVESVEQQLYLISLGCRFAQGYLFGKAVPASRVPRLIASPSKIGRAA